MVALKAVACAGHDDSAVHLVTDVHQAHAASYTVIESLLRGTATSLIHDESALACVLACYVCSQLCLSPTYLMGGMHGYFEPKCLHYTVFAF